MTGAIYVPFATQEILPDPSGRADGESYMGGTLPSVHGVVFHVNAGNGNPRNWWTSPTNHAVASAHLQIMKSGELKQYVPLNRVAWAEVNGNGLWHSVETEGFPNEQLTPAQFETFAKLLAWGHGAWGWPLQVTDDPNGFGVGTHQMGGAAWGGHACPGPLRAAQRPALIARALQLLGNNVVVPTPAPVQPPVVPAGGMVTQVAYGQTSEAVKGLQRFLNAYNWRPALPLLPVTGFYGPQTTAVLARAQLQMGVQGGDGRNVGPQTARAIWARNGRF